MADFMNFNKHIQNQDHNLNNPTLFIQKTRSDISTKYHNRSNYNDGDQIEDQNQVIVNS